MEENIGQQYALQIAVQTMKERCLQLQHRLSIVEEENMNLRIKNHIDCLDLSPNNTNKSDIEILHQKIAQLSKQKSQLTHNVLMVATENRHLWNRLSKLTQANQTLGDHLSKINETLNQNIQQTPTPTTSPMQTTLIRSKTFTHESPPKIVKKSEDFQTDTSLEDISLKLINSIAQEKYELEKQCAQMTELQSTETVLTSSIGFAYPSEEFDGNVVDEIVQNTEKLIFMKDSLIEQRNQLKAGFEILKDLIEDGVLCKPCKENKTKQDFRKNATDSLAHIRNLPGNHLDPDKICPVCNKTFQKEQLSELIKHVENHFIGEDDNITDNYELVIQDYTERK